MRNGYDRKEIEGVLVKLREGMLALVGRATTTLDSRLAVAQRQIIATYSGWDTKDVPASVPMLMRDITIRHDDDLDREISDITEAFAATDRMIREITGLDDEAVPARISAGANHSNVKQLRAKKEPKRSKAKVEDKPGLIVELLGRIQEATEAKSMDDLIQDCIADGHNPDRVATLKALRELQAAGDIVKVASKPTKYTAEKS